MKSTGERKALELLADAKAAAPGMDDAMLMDLLEQMSNDMLAVAKLQEQLYDRMSSLGQLHCYVTHAVLHRLRNLRESGPTHDRDTRL